MKTRTKKVIFSRPLLHDILLDIYFSFPSSSAQRSIILFIFFSPIFTFWSTVIVDKKEKKIIKKQNL